MSEQNPDGMTVEVTESNTDIDSAELFEKAMEAAIAKATPAEPEVPEVVPETPPEVEAAPEVPKPAPPAEEPATLQMRRLMAREKAAREVETKVKEERTALESVRAEVAAYQQRQNMFELDPVGYIRSLNPKISLAEVAKQLWLEELGENAPPEARATREVRSNRIEIEKMRAELVAERERLAKEQDQRQAEQAYQQYTGALEAYAKSAPDSLPLVKAYTAADSVKVVRGMLKIAENAAATGVVLSPEQCAQNLETKLAALRKALGTEQPKDPPAVAPPKAVPARTAPTLRNQHQSIQPNRAPEDDEDALFKKAMATALGTVRPQ